MNARSTVKYASILLAMVVLLTGCIFEDDGTTGAPCSYFPLNTGNEWEFVSPGIEGITYTTKILSSSGRGSLFSDVSHIIPTGKTFSNFMVIDDRCRVYVYDKALRHKYKCLSFTDEMYQKWFVIYGDLAVTLESKNDTVTTPAGTFTGCFHWV